jgi:hypothetical protein
MPMKPWLVPMNVTLVICKDSDLSRVLAVRSWGAKAAPNVPYLMSVYDCVRLTGLSAALSA